jgi:mRNA interferase HigB
VRVISQKKLREFWDNPRHAGSEQCLRAWYQVVKNADWTRFADVRNTYGTADLVGNKVVFDVGGNKYRLIAVIDYESHKLFVRFVLTHEEYDTGQWKGDTFGEDWKPRSREKLDRSKPQGTKRRVGKQSRRKGRRNE